MLGTGTPGMVCIVLMILSWFQPHLGPTLNNELEKWLGDVVSTTDTLPISKCKAIIAPFVFYSFGDHHIDGLADTLDTPIQVQQRLGHIRASIRTRCMFIKKIHLLNSATFYQQTSLHPWALASLLLGWLCIIKLRRISNPYRHTPIRC